MLSIYVSYPQEPFDLESMPKHFLDELDENQMKALTGCLRVLDLDKLTGTLYEFIETYVKHLPPNNKDWPYVQYFYSFILASW